MKIRLLICYNLTMPKEKIVTLNSRRYKYLSTNRRCVFISHKEYEQEIVISLVNNGGTIYFEITNLETKERTKLDNPETGTYTFPLEKGKKTKLLIKSKAAIGSYKIQKKTVIE